MSIFVSFVRIILSINFCFPIFLFQEYDLEQKIEVEIKMREGSARLLAAARHRAQSLEAARALLTSNERMSAYMAELQRRKKESCNKTRYFPLSFEVDADFGFHPRLH